MPQRGLSAKLSEIAVGPLEVPIEVIYVQPAKTADDRCIDFEDFAAHVERNDDPFSRTFAAQLRRWTQLAGSTPPSAPSVILR